MAIHCKFAGENPLQATMVKIGGTSTENKWNELTREQVKSIIFEINQEVDKIVAEMERELELIAIQSAIHAWHNLMLHFERKLKGLCACFPPYSAEKYGSVEDIQHRDILTTFKEFNKRKDCQDRYLDLKAEISALEEFVVEKAPAKKKHEETEKQLAELRAKIDGDSGFLKEAKGTIKNLTSTIIREKKAMQRDLSQMKRNKANALQRLSELRETMNQKEALLCETIEQKQNEEEAVKRELQENQRLTKIINDHKAKLKG